MLKGDKALPMFETMIWSINGGSFFVNNYRGSPSHQLDNNTQQKARGVLHCSLPHKHGRGYPSELLGILGRFLSILCRKITRTGFCNWNYYSGSA